MIVVTRLEKQSKIFDRELGSKNLTSKHGMQKSAKRQQSLEFSKLAMGVVATVAAPQAEMPTYPAMSSLISSIHIEI